jgi:hypothetical protein
MATVTGFTAARMLEIENDSIVDGNISGNNLILVTRGGTTINAGNVRGPQGIQGVPGPLTTTDADARYLRNNGDTSTGLLIIDRAAAECLRLKHTDTPYMSFYKGATRLGFIQAQSDEFKIYTDTDNPITFWTGTKENMRLRTTGTQETLTLAGKTPDCLIYFRNTIPSGTLFGYVGRDGPWGMRATGVIGDTLLQSTTGDTRIQAKYSVDFYPGEDFAATFLPQGHIMFGKEETEDDVPGFWWHSGYRSLRLTTNVDGAPNIYLRRQGGATGTGGGEPFLKFETTGGSPAVTTTVGSITRSPTGVAYNNTSDYRVKDVKGPITGALERIKLLKPVRAVYKSDPAKTEVDTFVAHEVTPAVPEALVVKKMGLTI